MARRPIEVVSEFLIQAFKADQVASAVDKYVADDATYVSLNYDSPDLQRIMPWAGTKHGKSAFVENFNGVTTRWNNEAFEITETLEDGDKVVMLGKFTQRSVKLDEVVTSALVVFARVEGDRITYFQYMEDTFATARSFRRGGTWTIDADPESSDPIEV